MKLFFAKITENEIALTTMSWILIFINFSRCLTLWTFPKIFHSFNSSYNAKSLVFFYNFLLYFNYFKIFFSYICQTLRFLVNWRTFQFLNLTRLNNITRIFIQTSFAENMHTRIQNDKMLYAKQFLKTYFTLRVFLF